MKSNPYFEYKHHFLDLNTTSESKNALEPPFPTRVEKPGNDPKKLAAELKTSTFEKRSRDLHTIEDSKVELPPTPIYKVNHGISIDLLSMEKPTIEVSSASMPRDEAEHYNIHEQVTEVKLTNLTPAKSSRVTKIIDEVETACKVESAFLLPVRRLLHDQQFAASSSGKQSHCNGLKAISCLVLQVLKVAPGLSYKDLVVGVLVSISMPPSSLEATVKAAINNDHGLSNSKEEQKIRRRVYDTLNVLTAAGALYKDDKKWYLFNACTDKTKGLSGSLVRYQENVSNNLSAERRITIKKDKLSMLSKKLELYRELVAKNRNNEENMHINKNNGTTSNSKTDIPPESNESTLLDTPKDGTLFLSSPTIRVKFPFVAIQPEPSANNKFNIVANYPKNSRLRVESNIPPRLYGDIEFVKLLANIPKRENFVKHQHV